MKRLGINAKITLEKLAAITSEKLREHELNCVLVGGGCVSIYSKNRYQSYDLDYVTHEDMESITTALDELGFEKKGRLYTHPNCPYFIEFVSPPVAIGNEPITHFEDYRTNLGTIQMLTPTDCVKDRLASYYHWDDKQALDQAIMVCLERIQRVNLKEIKNWSIAENQSEKFDHFNTLLKNQIKK